MLKKIFIAIIIIVTVLTVVDKTDYMDVPQTAYANSIGIDYDLETNEYIIYLYILNDFNLGQTQYAIGESSTLAYTATSRGDTLQEALWMITINTNIYLQYSHIRTMIIKDTFCNDNNIYLLYEFIKTTPDFYPNFHIYTTSNELSDIYKVENFSDTSAYYTILVNSKGNSKTVKTDFIDLANDLIHPFYTIRYPHLVATKDVFATNEDSYISLHVSGYSYFSQDYTITSFKWDSLPALKLLNNLSGSIYPFDSFDLKLNEYKLKTSLKNDELIVTIKMRGHFTNNTSGKLDDELLPIAKAKLTKQLKEMKETMDSYNIDVYNVLHLSKGKLDYHNCQVKYVLEINA